MRGEQSHPMQSATLGLLSQLVVQLVRRCSCDLPAALAPRQTSPLPQPSMKKASLPHCSTPMPDQVSLEGRARTQSASAACSAASQEPGPQSGRGLCMRLRVSYTRLALQQALLLALTCQWCGRIPSRNLTLSEM